MFAGAVITSTRADGTAVGAGSGGNDNSKRSNPLYIQDRLAARKPPPEKRWNAAVRDYSDAVPAVGSIFPEHDAVDAQYIPLALTLNDPPPTSVYDPPSLMVADVQRATALKEQRKRELESARRENRQLEAAPLGNLILETPRFRRILTSNPHRSHHGLVARTHMSQATTRLLPDQAAPDGIVDSRSARAHKQSQREQRRLVRSSRNRNRHAIGRPGTAPTEPALIAGRGLVDPKTLKSALGGMKTKAGWEEAKAFDSLIHDYRARTYSGSYDPAKHELKGSTSKQHKNQHKSTPTTIRQTASDSESDHDEPEDASFWLANTNASVNPPTASARPTSALIVPSAAAAASGSVKPVIPPLLVSSPYTHNAPHSPGRSAVRLLTATTAAVHHSHTTARAVAATTPHPPHHTSNAADGTSRSSHHRPLSPSPPPSLRVVSALVTGQRPATAGSGSHSARNGSPQLSNQHARFHRFTSTGRAQTAQSMNVSFASTLGSGGDTTRSDFGGSSPFRSASAGLMRSGAVSARTTSSAAGTSGLASRSARRARLSASGVSAQIVQPPAFGAVASDRPHRVPPPSFMNLPPRLECTSLALHCTTAHSQ